jgi:DNA polymerase-3 subunit chi
LSEAPKPEWWFYHLSRTTLEQAAAPLMSKCLEVGWRVLAVSPNADRRAALDAALWTFDEQSFLRMARPKRLALKLHGSRCSFPARRTM